MAVQVQRGRGAEAQSLIGKCPNCRDNESVRETQKSRGTLTYPRPAEIAGGR